MGTLAGVGEQPAQPLAVPRVGQAARLGLRTGNGATDTVNIGGELGAEGAVVEGSGISPLR